MRVVIILAARMGSTRFPGKMIAPLNGVPMLRYIIDRLKTSTGADSLMLATTPSSYPAAEPIVKETGIDCFVGSEQNVLARYYYAAKEAGADVIVRATGDNPFVSVECLDSLIDYHIKEEADLARYVGLPYGAGVETISFPALEWAHREAIEPEQREHITQYIYAHTDIFKTVEPEAPRRFFAPDVRLTVDSAADYTRAQEIVSALPETDIPSIIAYVAQKNR